MRIESLKLRVGGGETVGFEAAPGLNLLIGGTAAGKSLLARTLRACAGASGDHDALAAWRALTGRAHDSEAEWAAAVVDDGDGPFAINTCAVAARTEARTAPRDQAVEADVHSWRNRSAPASAAATELSRQVGRTIETIEGRSDGVHALEALKRLAGQGRMQAGCVVVADDLGRRLDAGRVKTAATALLGACRQGAQVFAGCGEYQFAKWVDLLSTAEDGVRYHVLSGHPGRDWSIRTAGTWPAATPNEVSEPFTAMYDAEIKRSLKS